MSYQKPDHARYVERAAALLGFEFDDLDDGGGYLFRVRDGERRLVLGAGPLCPYPLNSATAVSISKDKIFTNRLLSERGILNLGGRCFFLNDEHRKLRKSGYEVEDARRYIQTLGGPCFVKPLAGSRGDYAEVVVGFSQFEDYIRRVCRKYNAIIIQRIFRGEEFRVFVLEGEALFCIRKAELRLRGDGARSVRELIAAMNSELQGTGVSQIPEGHILASAGRHLAPEEVIAAGESVPILGRRNYSAGGQLGDLTEPCPQSLGSVAIDSAAALSLRVAGVDLFVSEGPLPPTPEIRVIEVNGNPGIKSLEALGRPDLIEKIWCRVLLRGLEESDG